VLTFPLVIGLYLGKHALDGFVLYHIPKIFVIREMLVYLEFGFFIGPFLFWLGGADHFGVLVVEFEFVDGVDELGEVEVGV
jgi:hypothetical protein